MRVACGGYAVDGLWSAAVGREGLTSTASRLSWVYAWLLLRAWCCALTGRGVSPLVCRLNMGERVYSSQNSFLIPITPYQVYHPSSLTYREVYIEKGSQQNPGIPGLDPHHPPTNPLSHPKQNVPRAITAPRTLERRSKSQCPLVFNPFHPKSAASNSGVQPTSFLPHTQSPFSHPA